MKKKIMTIGLKEAWGKSTLLWLLAGALAVFGGCDKNDGPGEKGAGKGQAKVRFTMGSVGYADGGEMTRSVRGEERVTGQAASDDGKLLLDYTLERVPSAQTRATQMANGVAVRVYVYDSNGYVKDAIIHVGIGSDVMWLDGGTAYNIYAVSYNTTSVPGGATLSLGSGAALTVSAADDVLYASTTITPASGDNSLTLDFNHVFSEITVLASTSSHSQEITACSAELNPGSSIADLSITTGALSNPGSAPNTISWTGVDWYLVTSEPARVYTGGATTGLELAFSLSINGGAKTGSILFNKALAPGSKYRLTVNLRMGGSRMADIQIGSYRWAKGNLYETNTPGVYAMYNEEWEHGNTIESGAYWNWGAMHPRTDWQTYWSSTGVNGTAGNAANWAATPSPSTDPCRAFSGNYRLPTETQLQNLVNRSRITTGTYSATNSTEGTWYGIDHMPTTDNERQNAVFFPAAGYRYEYTTEIINTGSTISYWSATTDGSKSRRMFNNGWNSWDRSVASTVRCIRN